MPSSYPDPAEIIVAQRGYSAWAMLPSSLVCALLSVLFLLTGRLFSEIRGLGENSGSWIFFVLTGIFWFVQLLRWLYRGATYVYVLTERRILVERGFRWPPIPPVELKQLVRVQWGMHQLSRPFHVGWIVLTTRDGREEVLRGILNPKEFATFIDSRLRRLQSETTILLPEVVNA